MLELGIHKICKDNKISIISRTPFGFGFLTGRISEKKKFPENDHRKYWNLKQTKKWIKLSKEIFKNVKLFLDVFEILKYISIRYIEISKDEQSKIIKILNQLKFKLNWERS